MCLVDAGSFLRCIFGKVIGFDFCSSDDADVTASLPFAKATFELSVSGLCSQDGMFGKDASKNSVDCCRGIGKFVSSPLFDGATESAVSAVLSS